MKHKVNIYCEKWPICDPLKSCNPQVGNQCLSLVCGTNAASSQNRAFRAFFAWFRLVKDTCSAALLVDTVTAQKVMIVSSIIIQAEQGTRSLTDFKKQVQCRILCRIVKACTINLLCGLRTSGALPAGTTGVDYSVETTPWPAGDNLRDTDNEVTTDQ